MNIDFSTFDTQKVVEFKNKRVANIRQMKPQVCGVRHTADSANVQSALAGERMLLTACHVVLAGQRGKNHLAPTTRQDTINSIQFCLKYLKE